MLAAGSLHALRAVGADDGRVNLLLQLSTTPREDTATRKAESGWSEHDKGKKMLRIGFPEPTGRTVWPLSSKAILWNPPESARFSQGLIFMAQTPRKSTLRVELGPLHRVEENEDANEVRRSRMFPASIMDHLPTENWSMPGILPSREHPIPNPRES